MTGIMTSIVLPLRHQPLSTSDTSHRVHEVYELPSRGLSQTSPVATDARISWVSSPSTSSLSSSTSPISTKCCQICLNKYASEDTPLKHRRLLDEPTPTYVGGKLFELNACKCQFCTNCLVMYIKQSIENCDVLPIHCPDSKCKSRGILSPAEVQTLLVGDELTNSINNAEPNNSASETLLSENSGLGESFLLNEDNKGKQENQKLFAKYLRIYENTEILRDPTRIHCPIPSCQNVCRITPDQSSRSAERKFESIRVTCDKCSHEFCFFCRKTWMPENFNILSECEQKKILFDGEPSNNKRSKQPIYKADSKSSKKAAHMEFCQCSLLNESNIDDLCNNSQGLLHDLKNIKRCPNCSILIERAEGCAQIMCKMCRHTFCFYCLTSLDNDFLLKHFTQNGPCRGKLGHSRFSLFVHRVKVIGIFASTIVLVVILSPLILLALPCLILSSKCRKACYKYTWKLN